MVRKHDDGFTLVELVVVVAVLGVITGAIAGALVAVVRTTGVTASRISQSHDEQLLSTWLVPDLQSANGALGSGVIPTNAAAPNDAGLCPSGSTPLASLRLAWTDVAENKAYSALYEVDTASWVLRRTLSIAGVPQPSFVVVHNLEDPNEPVAAPATARNPVCFVTSNGKTTITVTTLVRGQGASGRSDQYTFSVSVESRTPFPPPPPPTKPPLVLDTFPPQSRDLDADGAVNQIIVTFDQPIECAGVPCSTSKWKVINQPGAGATTPNPTSVFANGSRVTLTFEEKAFVDTVAKTMEVAMEDGGVLGPAGPAAAFAKPVVDGMGPVVREVRSRDRIGPDGKLDAVDVSFSERLQVVPKATDFTLSGGAAPLTVLSVSGTDADYTLNVSPAPAVDTVAAGIVLRLADKAVSDTANNLSTQADHPVKDGMPAFLTSLVADQSDTAGRITRMVATFTEAVSGTLTLKHMGSPIAASTSNPTPNTLSMAVSSAAPVDTSTVSYAVSGSASDAAANVLSLVDRPVTDKVNALLLSIDTTPAQVAPLTPGKIEPGDGLRLTFSEPLGSVPSGLEMDVKDDGSAGTSFTLPGLVNPIRLATGVKGGYASGGSMKCPMTVSRSGLTIEAKVTACSSGTPSEGKKAVGSIVMDPALRDGAGNPVAAPPPLAEGTLF